MRRCLPHFSALALLATCLLVPTTAEAGRGPQCDGRDATIVGTQRADRLVGTQRADVIVARSGDDVVIGRGGDDRICLGRGRDVADGGSGNDRIDGVDGLDAADRMAGGPGGDEFVGLGRGDAVRAGAGADRVVGVASAGRGPWDVSMGDGADLVVTLGFARGHRLSGGAGHDEVQLRFDGRHTWRMGSGRISSAEGGMRARGFEVGLVPGGPWRVLGTSGADRIEASSKAVRFLGRGGPDRFRGSDRRDVFRGNAGRDTYVGDFGGRNVCRSVERDPGRSC